MIAFFVLRLHQLTCSNLQPFRNGTFLQVVLRRKLPARTVILVCPFSTYFTYRTAMAGGYAGSRSITAVKQLWA